MSEEFIGNYKILKKIGAGGMAKVYLAVHKDVPNLRVVLKILSDSRLVERFKQEADKLALLDGNPHICQIKHFFNIGDDFAIAMEYIDGATLEDIIKTRERLPVDESIKIIGDILNILGFAHQKKIFHRDIKPGNIMLDKSGLVKIIDFGIAKAESDPNLTLAGTACGTPAYMAPEQFTPTERVDYALVDVYAVATTLYFMLTGELPFKGDNEFALRDAKLFNKPEKLSKLNPALPRELDVIILKALEKNPEDRYASCSEMLQALQPFIKKIRSPSITADAVLQETRPAVTRKKRRLMPFVIGGLAIVIIAALAYKIFFTGEREETPVIIPKTVGLTSPIPLSPPTGTVVENAIPSFVWEKSALPGAVYNLQYDRDSAFSNAVNVTYITDSLYTPIEPLAEGLYFWRVQTEDTAGNQSDYCRLQTFTVAPAEIVIPRGILEIKVTPAGDIYVDNQLKGRDKTNLELSLDTGRHKIRVANQKSVEKSFDRDIDLTENARLAENFKFTFPSLENIVKVKIGTRLNDVSLRNATIEIDGDEHDLKTPSTYEFSPGQHTVKAYITLQDGTFLEKDTTLIIDNHTEKLFIDFYR
ncbi:MAG: serine/threonine protein kinase [candidate division Zixibacteria bacterium]|nr:serine/threonine protein kinase [candidate division Zixibacteria bacterium]